jgi:uncharacterized membrane protein
VIYHAFLFFVPLSTELHVSKMNIIDVAKSLGLNQFVRLVTLAGVGSELILVGQGFFSHPHSLGLAQNPTP